MSNYTTHDVAQLLGLPVGRVRSYVRSGVLSPSRGANSEYRFSFQDIVIVRTAEALQASTIPARRVRRALKNLRRQLPAGRPLSAVRIVVDGDEIVASDSGAVWHPESGQLQFDFSSLSLAADAGSAAPSAPVAVLDAEPAVRDAAGGSVAAEVEPESADLQTLELTHRQVLATDPRDTDAHVSLGRLLHEMGNLAEAEWHYRQALESAPHDATVAFDLAVALEDLGRTTEARDAYAHAIRLDPHHADAHFNISRLYEQSGDRTSAFRHLAQYKRLVETDR